MLLHVNLAFEIEAVAQFHKFMGVARIAVLAGKLAAAVRVDHPGKRHTRRKAAGKHRTVFQRDVLNIVAFVYGFTLGGQLGNTDKASAGFDLGK